MNPFEMVLGIVLITSIASVARARYGHGGRRGRHERDEAAYLDAPHDDGEADRLRGEVRQLKERIQVLERIVTDGDRNRSLALEQEIERLRDHAPARRTQEID